MSRKLLIFGVFIIGLAGGFLSAVLVPWPQTWRSFSDQYVFKVVEQITLASELRAGRHEDIRERIESQLPGSVIAIHTEMMSSPNAGRSLSLIKSYYLKHQIPIPSEIQPILDGVPEEEFCYVE
jgi:hypothetical protein